MIAKEAVPDTGSDDASRVALIDDPARSLITDNGLSQTLFVEAGAGSGKTRALVTRIVNLVINEGVSMRSIAAITFTEAAAAELASRIRSAFESALAEALQSGDESTASRCLQAIDDSDLAAISTLHGFANRILSEFSVAAGLPPRIRVLDEVSSHLAHEQRWERFVDRLHDTLDHEQALVLASVLGIALEPAYPDQTTLRDVAADFNQNWDRLAPLTSAVAQPLRLGSFDELDRAVDDVAALFDECSEPDDKLLAHLRVIVPQMQGLQAVTDPLRKLRLMAGLTVGWGRGSGGRAAAWGSKEAVAAAKDRISAVNDAMKEIRDQVTDQVLAELCRLIAIEISEAAAHRRAEGGLEFHDLLVLARDMLRRNEPARRALHERYRHLLLDEFQDTDPIQVELAVLIATSQHEVGTDAWHDLPVDDGRLFFVGDPKQSIYRFRRADIGLFLQARDRFAGDGRSGVDSSSGPSVQLQTNFRTVAPVLDWVNSFFAREMPEEIDGSQPAYVQLEAFRTASAADHRPVLLGGPHADPKVKASALREAEAADVARAVQTILGSPADWPVWEERAAEWRDARLSDITVLLPARTSLPFLRGAFDEADIRYRIATGTLVYDTQEVRDALAALAAIDDPTDEISLIAALRSPLYGCSDVDLFTFHQRSARWDLRVAPNEAVPADHPVRSALAHLHSLWLQRWWLTPSAMLDQLLRDRRAHLLAFGNARPGDVWRRLRFLVDQARSFEEAGGGDLRSFTRWAALQGAAMARVHEPLLPETDEEALSIQTIHGAKGLEFPITILSGLTTQMRAPRPGVSVLWGDDGMPQVRMRKGVQTRNHEPRADLEGEMDEFEKTRLAYVATTRARDHLLVSCHHKEGSVSRSWAGRIYAAFADDELRPLWRGLPACSAGDSQEETHQQVGLALDDRESWVSQREALLERSGTRRVFSATGIARAAAGSAVVHGPGQGDDDDDRADQTDGAPIVQRRRGRTGSAVGSAVHAVLQVVDLAAPAQIARLVAQQCEVEAIPDRTMVVQRLVQSALESRAVQMAARFPHHKEVFVAAPLGERVIEGYVDLLIEIPDGLVVVDYKTDNVSSDSDVDAKLAIYELQAAAYAVALERAAGRSVVGCEFVFCRSTGAIERSVVELDRLKAQVKALVTQ